MLKVSADYLLYGSEIDTAPVNQALMKMIKDDQQAMKDFFVGAMRILDEIPKKDTNEVNEKSQP